MLSDEDLGKIFRACMTYGTEEETSIPAYLMPTYNLIVNQIKIDKQRYEDKVEKRRAAGRLGGAPIGNQNAKKTENQSFGDDKKNKQNKQMVEKTSKNKQKQTKQANNININSNINNNSNSNKNINKNISTNVDNIERGQKNVAQPDGCTARNIDARKYEFEKSLVPYLQTYGAEMLRAFADYWTEPNKSKSKMRFEMERTWDTVRRLRTWASRERVPQATGTSAKTTIFEEIARLQTQANIIEI